jgi:leucyl/phenylalanyl-tRNA---protein transferase
MSIFAAMPIYSLPKEPIFPPVSHAEEDGMLAVGGDLSPERLLNAYAHGIFPWYNEGESPILWWSPDPRMVLFPAELKVSKSMQTLMRRNAFQVTFDREFALVIGACSQAPRPGQDGTWLGKDMQKAYLKLHDLGFAHSVEVWNAGRLVGGLYGLALGRIFCGESMFAFESNASKFGFITAVQKLEQLGFELVDCQVYTEHLESLGAREIPRNDFIQRLSIALEKETIRGPWTELLAAKP